MYCSKCNKEVVATRIGGNWHCLTCGSPIEGTESKIINPYADAQAWVSSHAEDVSNAFNEAIEHCEDPIEYILIELHLDQEYMVEALAEALPGLKLAWVKAHVADDYAAYVEGVLSWEDVLEHADITA